MNGWFTSYDKIGRWYYHHVSLGFHGVVVDVNVLLETMDGQMLEEEKSFLSVSGHWNGWVGFRQFGENVPKCEPFWRYGIFCSLLIEMGDCFYKMLD